MKRIEPYLKIIEKEILLGKTNVLSKKVSVDREVVLEAIDELRENIPLEINESIKIIEGYKNMKEDALIQAQIIREDAENIATQIIDEAKAIAEELIAEHNIYREAIARRNNCLEDVKDEVEEMRLETREYADSILEETGKSVISVVEQIEGKQAELIEFYRDLYDSIDKIRESYRE